MPRLHIFKTEKETCNAFAQWFSEQVEEVLTRQEKFSVVLSGGDTPRLFYRTLAQQYADKIDWSRIVIFWGDEKFVKSPDNESNAATAQEMLLDHVPIPRSQVHLIPTDLPPNEAAEVYEATLKTYFNKGAPTFDLVILGMGKNGNTLSLFPGNNENNEQTAWVIPVYQKEEDLYRITLTPAAINAATLRAFLITGKVKQDLVAQAVKGKYNPEKYPAQLLQAGQKTVHWFLDEGAAGKLIHPTP